MGNVISMAVTGIILKQLNWRWVFYIYGVIGLLWYAIWLMFVSDTPAEHKFISEKEKKYLMETVTDVTDSRRVSAMKCNVFHLKHHSMKQCSQLTM